MFAAKLQAFSPPTVVYAASQQHQLQTHGHLAAPQSSTSPSAYVTRQSPQQAPQVGRYVGDTSGARSQARAPNDDDEIEDDVALSGAGGDSISSSYTQDFEDAEASQSIQVHVPHLSCIEDIFMSS